MPPAGPISIDVAHQLAARLVDVALFRLDLHHRDDLAGVAAGLIAGETTPINYTDARDRDRGVVVRVEIQPGPLGWDVWVTIFEARREPAAIARRVAQVNAVAQVAIALRAILADHNLAAPEPF